MSDEMRTYLNDYINRIRDIYGPFLKSDILYGSYARGDYRQGSDIDVMILLDLTDMEIKNYRRKLSGMTFDFNMDHDLEINPTAKSQKQFDKWADVYPFYSNVRREGVSLFES